MRMTVPLPSDGRSILIPCGECGSLLKLSLLRQAVSSGLFQGADLEQSKRVLNAVDALLLQIASVPTEAARRPA